MSLKTHRKKQLPQVYGAAIGYPINSIFYIPRENSPHIGEKLTPYGQAFRYNNYLPYEERARWIVVSNFENIMIYNMSKPNGEPEQIFLKDLAKDYYRLQFLVEKGNENLKREMEISLKAGELVGKLYDAILKQYKNPENPETLRSLNMLCVRLVFCLYAEDAGIFGSHEMFGRYLQRFGANEIRSKLIDQNS